MLFVGLMAGASHGRIVVRLWGAKLAGPTVTAHVAALLRAPVHGQRWGGAACCKPTRCGPAREFACRRRKPTLPRAATRHSRPWPSLGLQGTPMRSLRVPPWGGRVFSSPPQTRGSVKEFGSCFADTHTGALPPIGPARTYAVCSTHAGCIPTR